VSRPPSKVVVTIFAASLIALAAEPATAQPGTEGVPWYKRVYSGCLGTPVTFHPCALAKAKTFNPPRTVDGKPDMGGYWYGGPANSQNMEPDPGGFGVPAGPGVIVDPPNGKIPYRTWAAAQRPKNPEEYADPHAQCFPSGVPRMMYAAFGYQIIQIPGYVATAFMFNHVFRVIPTDGRPHIGADIRLWQADSRGHWEGDTLVVDSSNQNNYHWLDAAGNFWGAGTHVVERLTMLDADTIHYEATITDPMLYTQPWKMAFPIRRNAEEGFEQWEYACHEGEMNVEHLRNLGRRTFGGFLTPD
jgi:hypothetical protein